MATTAPTGPSRSGPDLARSATKESRADAYHATEPRVTSVSNATVNTADELPGGAFSGSDDLTVRVQSVSATGAPSTWEPRIAIGRSACEHTGDPITTSAL